MPMAAAVAERIVEVIQTLAPVALGVIFVVLGLLNDINMALIGLGAGLLGVPGITQSIQSARSNKGVESGGGAHESR